MISGDESNSEEATESDTTGEDEAESFPLPPAEEATVGGGSGGGAGSGASGGDDAPANLHRNEVHQPEEFPFPREAILRRMRRMRLMYDLYSRPIRALLEATRRRNREHLRIHENPIVGDGDSSREEEQSDSDTGLGDDTDYTGSEDGGVDQGEHGEQSGETEQTDGGTVTEEEAGERSSKDAAFDSNVQGVIGSRDTAVTVGEGGTDGFGNLGVRSCSGKEVVDSFRRNREFSLGEASGSRSSAQYWEESNAEREAAEESGYIGGEDTRSGEGEVGGSRSSFEEWEDSSPEMLGPAGGTCASESEDTGLGEGKIDKVKRRHTILCAFPGCTRKHMPLTPYCHTHILSDERQKLYKPCAFITESSEHGTTICGAPILVAPQLHYCPAHTQLTRERVSEALERAGLTRNSDTPLPKINVILAEMIRQIQARRRQTAAAGDPTLDRSDEHNPSSPEEAAGTAAHENASGDSDAADSDKHIVKKN